VSPPEPQVTEVAAPGAALAGAIRQLVATSPDARISPPISERGLLHLRSGPPFRHFVLQQDAQLIGYAQLDEDTDHVGVELVAGGSRPDEVAVEMLAAVDLATRPAPLRMWAHGSNSVAHVAARRIGLIPVRALLQMRRTLAGLPAAVPPPAGVVIRPFVPGQDDEKWLAVNARAFADHPEQGRWTQADLADRLTSDWFAADGFLLAERAGELVGFHWTKVHSDAVRPVGEVYVLGVDPRAQKIRLGRTLLLAGLRHLRQRGLDTVLLYTDQSNVAAVRLYTDLGFEVFATDTQYARPAETLSTETRAAAIADRPAIHARQPLSQGIAAQFT